jgi:N,N'-diacetyllegionaminate synthase
MRRNATLVIAEAGVNHNGDMGLARRLIDVAAEAGADLVKFQTFVADRLATSDARKATYQISATGEAESQLAMLRRLELSEADHVDLIAHCRARGIGFFSTGFDVDSVALLLRLGAERFKIPSGEITNLPYLRYVGGLGKPLLLSTGMATMGDIEAALNVLETAGTPRAKIVVLHCTTDYPTLANQANLLAMQNIGQAFGVEIGYSDHTEGIEVAIAAVALGATVIEKHITLDRSLPGPDHKASIEPGELRALVASIRNVERALGDGVKRPTDRELANRLVARKSLVASREIKEGELFSSENIVAKRPGTGASPMRWDEFIGRPARRSFAVDEPLEL